MNTMFEHLKTNFKPNLKGISSGKSSTPLSNALVECFKKFKPVQNAEFYSKNNPIEFLTDGIFCDIKCSSKGSFPFKIYWAIEWEWYPAISRNFINHDLVKLCHVKSDNKLAIFLSENKDIERTREEIATVLALFYDDLSNLAKNNFHLIEISRTKEGAKYSLKMSLLKWKDDKFIIDGKSVDIFDSEI